MTCLGSVRIDVMFTKPASLSVSSISVKTYSSRKGSVVLSSVNRTGDNSYKRESKGKNMLDDVPTWTTMYMYY